MPNISVSEARSKLYHLIDETASSHRPIIISGKRSNAVLISEDDWNAIQETLYLLSIPVESSGGISSEINSDKIWKKT